MTSEKTSKQGSLAEIDPGSLMLASYVFAVTALVLLGWLGFAGAGSETDAADIPAVIVQLQR